MTTQEKMDAFVTLGKFFSQFRSVSFFENPDLKVINKRFGGTFADRIIREQEYNPWFTPENVRLSLGALSDALLQENLAKWLSSYSLPDGKSQDQLDIGVIMAGNIPLVGFHDFLSVIFSGHRLTAKLPDRDDRLLPAILEILEYLNKDFKELVSFQEGPLKKPDAIIATGSDNSSRYFEYYFGKYPHIIRRNRNSTAVLDGSESKFDLEKLADDIFMYFGLGCRNVSKIYLPKEYEIPHLLDHFQHYAYLVNHHKYANNYEYQRAVHLVNQSDFYDTGFLVVKEDSSYSSPVGSLYFERYHSAAEVTERLQKDRERLQCITGRFTADSLEFGHTQTPMLWEYADNVNTLEFLLNL